MVGFKALILVTAAVANLSSASSLFLVTQRLIDKSSGKATFNGFQLLAYNQDNVDICTNGNKAKLDAICDKPGKQNTADYCIAKYNGSNPWKDIIGIFETKSSYVVSDGSITVDRKDGTERQFKVTSDKLCKKYSCVLPTKDTNLRYDGFRCNV